MPRYRQNISAFRHREERSLLCHREERSDVAIHPPSSVNRSGLPRCARNDAEAMARPFCNFPRLQDFPSAHWLISRASSIWNSK